MKRTADKWDREALRIGRNWVKSLNFMQTGTIGDGDHHRLYMRFAAALRREYKRGRRDENTEANRFADELSENPPEGT